MFDFDTIATSFCRAADQIAEENDVNSFKKILFAMIETEGKKIFNKYNE